MVKSLLWDKNSAKYFIYLYFNSSNKLKGRCYDPFFTDEETDTERLKIQIQESKPKVSYCSAIKSSWAPGQGLSLQ